MENYSKYSSLKCAKKFSSGLLLYEMIKGAKLLLKSLPR
jgi:hypothetical protein